MTDLDGIRQRIGWAAANGDTATLATLAGQLADQVEHLHTWHGLMSVVDEHYPTAVFPVGPDDDRRDDGPRILSLLRHLDAARAEANRVRDAAHRRVNAERASTDQVLADVRTIRRNLLGAQVCDHCRPVVATALNKLGPLLTEAGDCG